MDNNVSVPYAHDGSYSSREGRSALALANEPLGCDPSLLFGTEIEEELMVMQ
jgi:hypothetical protein